MTYSRVERSEIMFCERRSSENLNPNLLDLLL
ncbi:hypothetical protein GGP91_003356 [Salinibacter ruber]|nr:hypothetical protein [Salinibacter ruber]MCS3831255.1 hypothetical protein [Salinibacter ruber]MCS4057908.1 hypothetical protein [Salinibacter ruber]MCS4061032.1 hypothetical protein [Salinibacter ruber]MCS4103321.1 hypothetical protein [Salinibacter ruber]